MAKVVLKNTTKISLNERFTAYRQQAEASALRAAAAAAVAVPQCPTVPQPSMRNVRLAQQMATRPSVLAALRLRKAPPVLSGGYMVPSPSLGGVERGMSPLGGGWVLQRSLRQRLGPLSGGVKARLGLRPFHPSGLLLRSRLGLRPIHANGARAAQPRRNRGAARAYYRQPRANGTLRGQFRPRNRRRRAQQQQQMGTAANAVAGGQTDRRQLDQQLEAYMARTRSHLDAELDAYMAQASSSNT
ncbi:chromatin target of PRMT1 protein-like isoform X2 [Amblyomma americanum]